MPPKILSVDDNPIICLLVASSLRPYDCLVCEATDGEEGLAAAVREKPDLIILDISMPVMDGIAMLTKLRQKVEYAQTPVIMLTAWSDQERVLQASELGVRDYLVKPFTKAQLVQRAGRVVTLALKSGATAPAAISPAVPLAETPPAAASDLSLSDPGKNYGLLIPENVIRLANLVCHQDVDLEEIAKVIGEDEELISRLSPQSWGRWSATASVVYFYSRWATWSSVRCSKPSKPCWASSWKPSIRRRLSFPPAFMS
jgi:CheY-like chemotaxis protein